MKRKWSSLSAETKIGAIAMPIVVAILAGLVIPRINSATTPDPPAPVRDGVVRVVDVRENVPLADFAAENASATLQPQEYVLAAQATDDDAGAEGDDATAGDKSTGEVTDGDDEATDDGATDDGATQDDDEATEDGTTDDGATDDGTTHDGGIGGTVHEAGEHPVATCANASDCDGDGVADAADPCPTTAGTFHGCPFTPLQIEAQAEQAGCGEDEMSEGSERCDDLAGVLGATTGSTSGDVAKRARKLGAALQETRKTRPHGTRGRVEPVGVEVSVRFTITGMKGKRLDIRWSLRHAKNRRIPQKWLRNRSIMKITPDADRDSGSADFWVPLPKAPRGPFYVRITLRDENGTALTFAKTRRFR